MTITRDQAAYLAPIIAACRPHGARQWQHSEVTAAIVKLGHLGLADVILAAVRCAQDRHAESPFAITSLDSPHWRERQGRPITEPNAEPYDRETYCGTCSEPRHRCELLWAGDHEFESVAKAGARVEPYDPEVIRDAKVAVSCEEPREPEERETKADPRVDQLRHLAETGATTEAAAAAESEA